MSVRVMSHIWQHSAQSGNALLLLLAISDFADDSGHAYPSVAALARKVRLSERTVQRMLRELEGSGELRITRRGGAGRRDTHRFSVLTKGDNLTPLNARKGDKSGAFRVTNRAVKGDTAVSPEPPIEPPIGTTTNAKRAKPTRAPAGGGGGGVLKILESHGVRRNRRTIALAERLAAIGEEAAQALIDHEADALRRDKTVRSFQAVLVSRLEQADLSEAQKLVAPATVKPQFVEFGDGHAHES